MSDVTTIPAAQSADRGRKTTRGLDKGIQAIAEIDKILDALDPAEVRRAIAWAADRYDVRLPAEPTTRE